MLNETEARATLKANGWIPRVRNVRGTVKHYLYAYRRNKALGGKVEERYVCRVVDLAQMSEADILNKLS
jgi:hypothetical protein